MSEDHDEAFKHLFYTMLLFILFVKFLTEAYFEKVEPRIGHNTGITVILGMICSFIIYKRVG